jgi:small nuclear ribonucleoprotein (snRNP)-like protein
MAKPGAVATGVNFPMKELLSRMVGREVDVVCTGTSSLRGKIVEVDDDVLQLKDDEDNVCYVAIDKIVSVWEKRDKDRHPGFVFKS